MVIYRVEWFNKLPKAVRKSVHSQLKSERWRSHGGLGLASQMIDWHFITPPVRDKKTGKIPDKFAHHSIWDRKFTGAHDVLVVLRENNELVGFADFFNGRERDGRVKDRYVERNFMALDRFAIAEEYKAQRPVILNGMLDKAVQAARGKDAAIRERILDRPPEHVQNFIDLKLSGKNPEPDLFDQLERVMRQAAETMEAELGGDRLKVTVTRDSNDPHKKELYSIRSGLLLGPRNPDDPRNAETHRKLLAREKELERLILEKKRRWDPDLIPKIAGRKNAKKYHKDPFQPDPKAKTKNTGWQKTIKKRKK